MPPATAATTCNRPILPVPTSLVRIKHSLRRYNTISWHTLRIKIQNPHIFDTHSFGCTHTHTDGRTYRRTYHHIHEAYNNVGTVQVLTFVPFVQSLHLPSEESAFRQTEKQTHRDHFESEPKNTIGAALSRSSRGRRPPICDVG